MIFEIASVEEGEGVNDVVLTVNYWHQEAKGRRRPNRDPDYVEEHVIIGVPDEERVPRRTALGHFVGVDGSVVMGWKINAEGDLVRIDPNEISDQIEWYVRSEEQRDALLLRPVNERALAVAEQRKTGVDVERKGGVGVERVRNRPKQRPNSLASRRRGRIAGYIGEI